MKEYSKFDQRMSNDKYRKKFDKYIEGVDHISKQNYSVAVGP